MYDDAGYYKVNPPVNKWTIAGATLLSGNLVLPPIAHSSNFPNEQRPEFTVGDSLLELNEASSFRWVLMIARLGRVPLLLLASWMLWSLTERWSIRGRNLCQLFWCTSPLILGHGCVISADALSGVAMCFVLFTTVVLWKNPSWFGFVMSGLAWGIAIGTKFTFGPLILAYPLAVHLCSPRGWTSSLVRKPAGLCNELTGSVMNWFFPALRFWFLFGFVACLVVNVLYLFHETAMPIGKHDFIGKAFRSLTIHAKGDGEAEKQCKSLIALLPSPFPRSFLEGVDQQMADMDRPRGVFLLGNRFEGENHWFFLVGYAIKEQLAVHVAIVCGLIGLMARLLQGRSNECRKVVLNRSDVGEESKTVWGSRSVVMTGKAVEENRYTFDESLRLFSAFYLVVFALFMATQSNLVWNVRYLIPALPMIYLLVSYSIPSVPIRFPFERQPQVPEVKSKDRASVRSIDLVFVLVVSLASTEFFRNSPHHFSYINPLFGGSYRVPIALNDSNFDYGQDLLYVRDWVCRYRANSTNDTLVRISGVLSGHGSEWLNGHVLPASLEDIENAIRARSGESNSVRKSSENSKDYLIISRGLFHPEPWAVQYSKLGGVPLDNERLKRVQTLLAYPPDMWITPVIAVYRH